MQNLRHSPVLCLLLSIAPAFSGCAAIGTSIGGEAAYNAAFRTKIVYISQAPLEDQLKFQQVKFLDPPVGTTLQSKGEVAALSCKLTPAVFVFRWVWHPDLNEVNGATPEEAARRQLLFKAAHLGANAVINTVCTHKDGIDWGNNCFESWACTGQAVIVR